MQVIVTILLVVVVFTTLCLEIISFYLKEMELEKGEKEYEIYKTRHF